MCLCVCPYLIPDRACPGARPHAPGRRCCRTRRCACRCCARATRSCLTLGWSILAPATPTERRAGSSSTFRCAAPRGETAGPAVASASQARYSTLCAAAGASAETARAWSRRWAEGKETHVGSGGGPCGVRGGSAPAREFSWLTDFAFVCRVVCACSSEPRPARAAS